MPRRITPDELAALGVPPEQSAAVAAKASSLLEEHGGSPETWHRLRREVLAAARPRLPFPVHRFLYSVAHEGRPAAAGPGPAWAPHPEQVLGSNLGSLMAERGAKNYAQLFRWSVEQREEFWAALIERVGIRFRTKPRRILDPQSPVTAPDWLPGAELNIVDSCFQAEPGLTALRFRRGGGPGTQTYTFGELEALVNRVAHGLDGLGLGPRDPVAIYMPMTPESVAAYLGIIRSGRVAVGVADTSAPGDFANKVRISGARLVVTVDAYRRGGKAFPTHAKVVEAKGPPAVVVPGLDETLGAELRRNDVAWSEFLGDGSIYDSKPRRPHDPTNILFSSGTTKDPKAIPWTHTTPIKSIVDGHLHHDIRRGDVVAWPTSFGWMMGPWLTYASLVPGASMAVYDGDPRSVDFGRFVEEERVTMLGTVPKLVKAWRAAAAYESLDWSRIRAFSSTGETSDPDDMLWLMHLAGYKPIIEYCGGTEIGGGYLTGTVVQPAAPSTFTTPSMGLDFYVLDESGRPTDRGEVGLVPPSIGFSNTLINYDHHEEYFTGFHRGPEGETLRRHGDQLQALEGGGWRHLGRLKDMINLNGVKTSSEEIRHAIGDPRVADTKPVAVDVEGRGQHALIVYAVPRDASALGSDALREELKAIFRDAIRKNLNPLLAHVHDVVLVDALPQAGPGKTLTSEWFRKDYESRLAQARA